MNKEQIIEYLVQNNTGEIQINDTIGHNLIHLMKFHDIKNVLDIGTWSGKGTTLCLYLGKTHYDRSDLTIHTIEINKQRHEMAREFYKNLPNIKLYNGTILSKLPSYTDMRNRFPNIVKDWLFDDILNFENSEYIYNKLPKIDLVVFDGSEYLTYYEYLVLKDKVNYIICDDSNVEKCDLIKNELVNSDEWICLFIGNERNGNCGFRRKVLL